MSDPKNGVKVFYVSHSRKCGGAEMVLLNLLKASSGDWKAVVFVPPGDFADMLEKEGISTIRSNYLSPLERRHDVLWPFKFVYKFIMTAIEMTSAIKKEDASLIHSNHFVSTPYCIIPSLITRRPLLWHMHDIQPFRSANGLAIFVTSLFVKRIIAVSDAVVTGLRKCHVRGKLIMRCWNGLDGTAGIKDREQPDGRYFRKRDGRLNIVQIGVLSPVKGCEILIDAAGIVEKDPTAGNKADYYFVGGEMSAKDRYKDVLNEKISKAGLDGRIKLCGHLSAMRTVYENTGVLVLPSVVEDSFPTVILEAMAMGVPVVASSVGGVPEMISDGYNGFLFKKNDSNALAAILRGIICKRMDTAGIIDNGRAVMRDKFTIKAQKDCIGRIYSELLK